MARFLEFTRRGVLRLTGGALVTTGTAAATGQGPGRGNGPRFKCSFSSIRDKKAKGTVYFDGTARGTRIGNGTVNHHHDPVNVDSGDRHYVNGYFEITAANGDTLTGTYSGDVDDESPASAKTGSGEWEHTGGTGRFDGATGEGTLTSTADLTKNSIELHLDGTIRT